MPSYEQLETWAQAVAKDASYREGIGQVIVSGAHKTDRKATEPNDWTARVTFRHDDKELALYVYMGGTECRFERVGSRRTRRSISKMDVRNVANHLAVKCAKQRAALAFQERVEREREDRRHALETFRGAVQAHGIVDNETRSICITGGSNDERAGSRLYKITYRRRASWGTSFYCDWVTDNPVGAVRIIRGLDDLTTA